MEFQHFSVLYSHLVELTLRIKDPLKNQILILINDSFPFLTKLVLTFPSAHTRSTYSHMFPLVARSNLNYLALHHLD